MDCTKPRHLTDRMHDSGGARKLHEAEWLLSTVGTNQLINQDVARPCHRFLARFTLSGC